MKKYLLFISLCCLSLLQLSAATPSTPTRVEKKRFSNISEIKFDQSYGNIVLRESDSKQVDLEIQYFDGKNHQSISEITLLGNSLSIRTIHPKDKRNDNCKIDYFISVPRNTALTVDLRYGNINMSDFHGDFIAQLAYSNLKAETFFCPNPTISCKYGTISMSAVEDLNIQTSYSNVAIGKIKTLKVENKYTNYTINQVQTIAAESATSYGNFKIGSASAIYLNLKYADLIIDNLETSLKTKCAYADVKIKNISKKLENIDLQGSYSDIVLSLDPELSANLDIHLKYGDLKVASKYTTKYSLSGKENNKLVKKGVIGNKTPTANIVISNTYNNITIK
ncbi:MAG: DUF4097 domain-containing protein [Candidatus Symbiothrix sp.]|jgi:hypothetical protein|nr:DUF4097 domain-containing protein [Candidatus Symbiothrix sp.]